MQILSILAELSAVVGAVITVIVYRDTVNREKKISTLEIYSQLRDKYTGDIETYSDEQKLAYLKELEFFCTGINEGIYDIHILKKMCGKRLIRQYNSTMKDFVTHRRQIAATGNRAWTEYESTILKLKKLYPDEQK